jgi:hypothetical protein
MERFLFIIVYEKSTSNIRFFNFHSSLKSSRNSLDVYGPGAACPTTNPQKKYLWMSTPPGVAPVNY